MDKKMSRQSINLTLNDGDEVDDGGEGVQAGAHSPERWAAGPTTSSNQ